MSVIKLAKREPITRTRSLQIDFCSYEIENQQLDRNK